MPHAGGGKGGGVFGGGGPVGGVVGGMDGGGSSGGLLGGDVGGASESGGEAGGNSGGARVYELLSFALTISPTATHATATKKRTTLHAIHLRCVRMDHLEPLEVRSVHFWDVDIV